MALIVLAVLITLPLQLHITMSFTKSNCGDFIASVSGPQFIRPQSRGLVYVSKQFNLETVLPSKYHNYIISNGVSSKDLVQND